MTVPFELGEQKHVRLRVCSCKNENFLITAASYELYYRGAKEPEDTGHPEIQACTSFWSCMKYWTKS